MKLGRHTLASWIERAVLVALIGIAYVALWSPARQWVGETVVQPVLETVETDADAYTVEGRGEVVVIRNEVTGNTHRFQMTGGVLFLLPAVLLILVAPENPYWVFLWGLHVGFAAVFVLLLSIGISMTEWGFVAHRVLRGRFYTAVMLSTPFLPYLHASLVGSAER